MASDRGKIEVRVVPLRSREAGDAYVGGSVTERVAMVAELTRMVWSHTGKPYPAYTRATMPVVVTTLGAQSSRG